MRSPYRFRQCFYSVPVMGLVRTGLARDGDVLRRGKGEGGQARKRFENG